MKWNPTLGGYEKTCPTCGRAFIGRKNKTYCGIPCKSKQNNDLAFERNKVKQLVTEPLLRNIEILKSEISDQQDQTVEVPIDRLKLRGFDNSAPKIAFRPFEGAAIWYKYGDFAIHPDEEKRSITITKLKANG